MPEAEQVGDLVQPHGSDHGGRRAQREADPDPERESEVACDHPVPLHVVGEGAGERAQGDAQRPDRAERRADEPGERHDTRDRETGGCGDLRGVDESAGSDEPRHRGVDRSGERGEASGFPASHSPAAEKPSSTAANTLKRAR